MGAGGARRAAAAAVCVVGSINTDLVVYVERLPAAAALSVRQEGAQPSMPHRARIEALLAGAAPNAEA